MIELGRFPKHDSFENARYAVAGRGISCLIDNNGLLVVINENGGLALPKYEGVKCNIKIKSVVTCGKSLKCSNIVAIDENDKVWSGIYAVNTNTSFKMCRILPGITARNIAAHEGTLACVTTTGNLFIWGQYKYEPEPRKVKTRILEEPEQIQVPEKVLQVAPAEMSMLILDIHGTVYNAGRNKNGKLSCRPIDFEHKSYAKSGLNLIGQKIIQIASGKRHSACLTLAGCVYTWRNFVDKGGIKRTIQYALRCENIIQISMSHSHRAYGLLLSKDNKVYAWGCNRHGQCGNDKQKFINNPMLVKSIDNSKVIHVSAGYLHSLVTVESL